MSKNFYDILQINKNATKEEIKKSYKKLALHYHPDKNKDDDAIDKFREIAEAYDTLGDETKRKNYDMFGNNNEQFSGDPFSAFNDIFKQHMSSFMNMNMNYEKEINIGDILSNLAGFSNFNSSSNFDIPNIPNIQVKFHTLHKNPLLFPRNNVENENNDFHEERINYVNETIPKDIIINLDVSLEEIYLKQKKEILIDRYRNKNNSYKLRSKKLNIYIYDKEIILDKNGNENENSTLKGNIIININNMKHHKFKRVNDYDILYIQEITLKEYYNHAYFKIKLPSEEILNITNDNFHKNKSLLQKIENKGIPYLENIENKNDDESWNYGDLYIQYNIIFPEIDNLYDCINEIYEDEEDEEDEIKKNSKYKKYIQSKNCNMFELFDNI
jgi:molecular chaperone DnaJ